MGFRFQRRIKIAPGFRLNLSKSGASLSMGRLGAWLNLSARGLQTTLGIPGTGLSYRSKLGSKHRRKTLQGNSYQRQNAGGDYDPKTILECWRSQLFWIDPIEVYDIANIRPYKHDAPAPIKKSNTLLQARLRSMLQKNALENAEPVPILFYMFPVVISLALSGSVGFMLSFWVNTAFSLLIPLSLFVVFCALSCFCTRLWWRSYDPEKIERQVRLHFPEAAAAAEKTFLQQYEIHNRETQIGEQRWRRSEKKRVNYLTKLLAGDQEVVSKIVADSISRLKFPFSSGCDVAVSENGSTLYLNLDLPEIQNMVLSDRDRRYKDYLHLISGLVLLVVATTFSSAPASDRVLVGAYTQRGSDEKDTYIVTADIRRKDLVDPQNLNKCNPTDVLSSLGARARIDKNGHLQMLARPNWLSKFS